MTASAHALSQLRETIQSAQKQEETPAASPAMQNTSLEAIAMQAMGPYLKQWLDTNLSLVVERLVEKEIKRITEEFLKK